MKRLKILVRDENGRFTKNVIAQPVKAERISAKDVLYQPMIDEVAGHRATIEFRETFTRLGNEMVRSPGKLQMFAEFSDTKGVSEWSLTEAYAFLPNSIINSVAEKLGDATIDVRHFGSYFFATLESENVKIALQNGYGGGRAFELAPTINVRGQSIPVFLKARQVHSGELASFEFRVRETIHVSKVLASNQDRLDQLLEAPLTDGDRQWIGKAIESHKMSKKMGESLLVFAQEEAKTLADIILNVVNSVKNRQTTKEFSSGLEIKAEKMIGDILRKSAIAAEVYAAVKDLDTAQELSELKLEDEKTKPKRSFRL